MSLKRDVKRRQGKNNIKNDSKGHTDSRAPRTARGRAQSSFSILLRMTDRETSMRKENKNAYCRRLQSSYIKCLWKFSFTFLKKGTEEVNKSTNELPNNNTKCQHTLSCAAGSWTIKRDTRWQSYLWRKGLSFRLNAKAIENSRSPRLWRKVF